MMPCMGSLLWIDLQTVGFSAIIPGEWWRHFVCACMCVCFLGKGRHVRIHTVRVRNTVAACWHIRGA